MSLSGQVALVTGASSGIGAALARYLAAEGVTVGIVARRKERLAEVLAECREHAPDSAMWSVDLSDLDAAARVVHDAWQALGPIDILVNNAGMPKRRPVTEISFGEYEEVMRLDYLSPVRMAHEVLPKMIEQGSGQILMVASVGGRLGVPSEPAYCAAKGAMCMWAEAATIDLGARELPVRIKLVNPGPIDTEIWDLAARESPPSYKGWLMPASECAAQIAQAIEASGFEFYVPDMSAVVDFKNSDIDAFLEQGAAFARSELGLGEG